MEKKPAGRTRGATAVSELDERQSQHKRAPTNMQALHMPLVGGSCWEEEAERAHHENTTIATSFASPSSVMYRLEVRCTAAYLLGNAAMSK